MLRDKVVFLTIIKRRFRCLFCGKVFTEPDEAFGPRRRSSYRFREYLGREALHQTVRRTAQKEQVGEVTYSEADILYSRGLRDLLIGRREG